MCMKSVKGDLIAYKRKVWLPPTSNGSALKMPIKLCLTTGSDTKVVRRLFKTDEGFAKSVSIKTTLVHSEQNLTSLLFSAPSLTFL